MSDKENGQSWFFLKNRETSKLPIKKQFISIQNIPPVLLRYGLAIGLFAIALAISLLNSYFEYKINLTILLLVVLALSSWYGGRGPGILLIFLVLVTSIIRTPIPPESSIANIIFSYFSAVLLLVVIVLLISSRKTSQTRLRDSEERYRYLFENNPIPSFVYNLETKSFLAVNKAASQFYGYSKEEFLKMSFQDICPADQFSGEDESIHLSKIGQNEFWKHLKKDGRQMFVEMTSHELSFDGQPAKMVLANDITARKQAEDALFQLNESLEQKILERTTELEASNKEMESFSYSVSHDLRAPLRSISGFSNILLEEYAEKLDDEGRRVVNVICDNAQNMGQLIDDLLAFSRLGRKQIEPTVIDMKQLAQDVCLLIEPNSSQNKKLKIGDLPETNGDRALIRQVLFNLISNAVKYSRKKEDSSIEIGGHQEALENVYYIQDNGVGFNMKYSNKLFGVFQRLHSPEEFEGTGVGLAIVQRVIQRHGGRVWAEGEVNKGATFYFAIPNNYLTNMENGNGVERS